METKPVQKRTLKFPFYVDPSRLSRLRSVCLGKLGSDAREEYEVNLAGDQSLKLASLDHVTSLDNSARRRIERVNITYANKDCSVGVDIDSRWFVRISISVTGPDKGWTLDTFSAVEEQAERLEQSDTVAKARSSFGFGSILLLMWGSCTVAFASAARVERSNPKEMMWLSGDDVKEIKSALDGPVADPAALVLDIHRRQLNNLSAFESAQAHERIEVDKQSVLRVAPFLIIVGVVAYIFIECYPRAVFYWGDAKDWYDRVAERRKALWWTVVIGSVVSVVGNFLTAGLTSTP